MQSLAYDARAFAASYAYTDGGRSRTLWLTSADTLRQRLRLAQTYQLGGVVVNDLLFRGVPAELINALSQYKASVQAEARPKRAAVDRAERRRHRGPGHRRAQPGLHLCPAVGRPVRILGQPAARRPAAWGRRRCRWRPSRPPPSPTPTASPTATTAAVSSGNITPQATSAVAATTAPPAATSPSTGVFVPPPPIGAGTFQLGGQVPGFIGHPAQCRAPA